jgi:phosphate transport system substrate-binding protein
MKNKKLFISILLIIAITIGCVFAYNFFTGNKKEVAVNEEKEGVLFTLDNYPKVDASLATQPLTDAFASAFTGEKNISEDWYGYTNTHPAYLRLIDKEVDVIVVTEPSENELKYAKDKGVELEVTPVVKEGFVFYVNSNNPVNNLSLAQIKKIYSGKIANWNEVGGNAGSIRPFQRPANSGSQTGMLSLVMKDTKLMTPLKEDLVETMESIINLVADYDNGENAIGYSYYYYATTIFETIDEKISNKIKLLAIDGVKPTIETIKSGEYSLNTAYYIVTRKNDISSDAQKLVDAMLSEKGQKVAEEAGYVGVK